MRRALAMAGILVTACSDPGATPGDDAGAADSRALDAPSSPPDGSGVDATSDASAPVLSLAAFPGAEGAGANSVGGRGGAVYVVTTLADSGAGSLRACVEAKGPRTCVFAVGGTLRLKTGLYVTQPFLTVAGQSAPGGGITLTNADGAVVNDLLIVVTHDVTWQYTRFRNQYRTECSNAATSECGALASFFAGAHDVIADHNSLSWNQDDGYGIWGGASPGVQDVTLSMSLVAEALDSHSTGVIVGGSTSALSGQVTDIDMHHNLVMNDGHRNPLFKSKSGRIVANIFYNQAYYVSQVGGGGSVDLIGNVYKKGPMNAGFHEIQAFTASGTDALDGSPSLYVAGNVGWNQTNPSGDPWPMVQRVTGENGTENGAAPTAWKRTTPLPLRGKAISLGTDGIVDTVGASRRLDCDGAWVENRDEVDARNVKQYLTNTGITKRIAKETDVGGLPTLAAGTACADADKDGLPDLWESAHGLSPSDASDGATKRPNAVGYTNLELFLSGLFPKNAPLP